MKLGEAPPAHRKRDFIHGQPDQRDAQASDSPVQLVSRTRRKSGERKDGANLPEAQAGTGGSGSGFAPPPKVLR